MTGIEAFLAFPVVALHLAVVPRRIGANQLVSDPQLSGSKHKQYSGKNRWTALDSPLESAYGQLRQ